MLDVTTNNDAMPAKICGKNHKCLQVLCGTAVSKWLRLLNGSGRYKLLILKNPDFAAVKRKRLLNGNGGNSAFYGTGSAGELRTKVFVDFRLPCGLYTKMSLIFFFALTSWLIGAKI